jgi:DNA-binding CsgD family transcriptional regulator
MRVFTELTPECDATAQMYASGMEKKEIARRKFRAKSTISNQLQTAFEVLKVRNGRELSIKLAERLTGVSLKLDFSGVGKPLACALLAATILNLGNVRPRIQAFDGQRTRTVETARARTRGDGLDVPFKIQ